MRKLLPLVLLTGLVASAAQAATYNIHLAGGTTFTTHYAPIIADFDPSLFMFMTDQSNWVTVAADQVTDIVVLEEALGFGDVIDDVTIMIGFTVNDNLTPEELAALEAEGGPLEFDYSMPTFGEPNQGGGIPLGFLNMNTPPMGGAQSGGGRRGSGLAGGRRGASGGGAAEPYTGD